MKNTKRKRIISIILSFIMIFSMTDFFNPILAKAFNNSVKVKVRVESNDHTIVQEKEIDVSNFSLKPYGSKEDKDNITAIHVLIKALESENINCKDINKFESKGCTYISNIDGVKERSVSDNDGWMYYINNKYVNEYIGDKQIHNGDSMVVFFQEDYTKNKYSYFDKTYLETKVGQNINLNLIGVIPIKGEKENISNAQILVDNKKLTDKGQYVVTDSKGNVSFTINKKGTYKISATKIDKVSGRRVISRPYCEVKVADGDIKIDKAILINSIEAAKNIFDKADIGEKVGQYTKESKDILDKEINEAKNILNKEDLTLDELNKANTRIQNAILKFKDSINKNESLEKIINDVVAYYEGIIDNNFKTFDFITSMALRRAGMHTDIISKKTEIYNMSGPNNDSRNVMSLIAAGKSPEKYIKDLPKYDYEAENDASNIARSIIAMDMANVSYDKEKLIRILLNKAHDEGNNKISFGFITPGGYDDFLGEDTEDEYTGCIDVTAWAIIALANHKDIKNCKQIIEKAKKYLKSKQEKNGLVENASNTALVIQSIIALGENPNENFWLIQNEENKISMLDGILKCKKNGQFVDTPNSGIAADRITSQVLAALVDLNTMTSMYTKLKYEDTSMPVKVTIEGNNQVYNGSVNDLIAKAFDYNNIVIKNAAILWKSSNDEIATVKNAKLRALKNGQVEITAYISGNENIKDSIKIQVIDPPKVDYGNKLKTEIEFLKDHYREYKSYEFLAAPSAVISGIQKEEVREGIYRYTQNNTVLQNAKMIIELLGVGIDPRCDKDKDNIENYVENLERAQVIDGENKGKFIINKLQDENSIQAQAYAIIALDLVNGKYDRKKAVNVLLEMLRDKNYTKSSSYKFIKTEAVAMTALANYKNIDGVQTKVNELIEFFKQNQNEDGAFDMKAGSTYGNSPEATSAVVQALLANDIDPLSWQWSKNGNSILDGMIKSKFIGRNAATSGYCQGQGLNFGNTEATYYAFSALVQMLNKKCIFTIIKDNYQKDDNKSKPIKDYNKLVNESINKITDEILQDKIYEDWIVLDLNKLQKDISKEHLQHVNQNVKDNMIITDLERTVIEVLAVGGNPTNINGYNLIKNVYDKELTNEAINLQIFGLIALDSAKFIIPEDAKCTKEKLIKSILDNRTDDGGWTLIGNKILDLDITGMALAALAPYYNIRQDVKEAIDKVLETISKMQNNDGTISIENNKNSNSISMIIVGLSTLGIDVTKDDRFIKNENNLIDALMKFKSENKEGFGYTNNKYNSMATEQGLRALVAYKRLKEGKGSIYKFDFKPVDVVKPNKPEINDFKIENITEKGEFKLGTDAKVSIKATNNTKEVKEAELIVGLFNNDGQLVNYGSVHQSIDSGKNIDLKVRLNLPSKGIHNIKAFVWDSLEEMKPLSNIIEIPVK